MKLCAFDEGRGPLIGVIEGDSVLPMRDTVEMVELIRRGAGWTPAAPALPLASVRLLAPIVPKRNVFCVGWNYAEHFAEGKDFRPAGAVQEIPSHPALFSKNPFAIIGPEAAIRHPAPLSEELDYEVELAVVIGTDGRDISERSALDHVFGYTIANDVSVRDVQRTWHGGQWFKGKNFDTHLPLGPWIVTKDEIPDPQTLRITTKVNGVTKQDSTTKHMVFPVARIIAELSAGLTLRAGDVIITGTPEGVGMGRKPPEWLKPGDVVELEIERIGILRNRIERGV
jgi:2-keto-4-pentenoate hydratase/2-oxohepta-3-ene-1,7-dioic acid hydratase in catechol pathway